MAKQTTNGKKPDLIAYSVRKTESGEYWTRIGVAWKHNNTEGFNAELAVLPLNGKIVFLPPKEKPAGQAPAVHAAGAIFSSYGSLFTVPVCLRKVPASKHRDGDLSETLRVSPFPSMFISHYDRS